MTVYQLGKISESNITTEEVINLGTEIEDMKEDIKRLTKAIILLNEAILIVRMIVCLKALFYRFTIRIMVKEIIFDALYF